MFNRKTLFIIGAGAGADINLPVGRALAEDIADRTSLKIEFGRLGKNVDTELAWSFVGKRDPDEATYVRAFNIIKNGVLFCNSIDDFLNIHHADAPEVVTVGKAAIARSILVAERQSKLFVDQSNTNNRLDVSSIRDSWLVKFMQVLGPGRAVSEAGDVLNDVSFINFNYDRCLEHFLGHALRSLYGLKLDVAEDIVRRADIIHPYGSVGSLDQVPFGGANNVSYNFRTLSQGIKTYTEQIEDSAVLDKMKRAVREAECVVFLGFAYHKQNMKLLKPSAAKKGQVTVYATAYGMSDSDVAKVRTELGLFFPVAQLVRDVSKHPNILIENKLTCAQLFDYYAKSLAG